MYEIHNPSAVLHLTLPCAVQITNLLCSNSWSKGYCIGINIFRQVYKQQIILKTKCQILNYHIVDGNLSSCIILNRSANSIAYYLKKKTRKRQGFEYIAKTRSASTCSMWKYSIPICDYHEHSVKGRETEGVDSKGSKSLNA